MAFASPRRGEILAGYGKNGPTCAELRNGRSGANLPAESGAPAAKANPPTPARNGGVGSVCSIELAAGGNVQHVDRVVSGRSPVAAARGRRGFPNGHQSHCDAAGRGLVVAAAAASCAALGAEEASRGTRPRLGRNRPAVSRWHPATGVCTGGGARRAGLFGGCPGLQRGLSRSLSAGTGLAPATRGKVAIIRRSQSFGVGAEKVSSLQLRKRRLPFRTAR